eukprot:3454794-Alexandrium_andersonii.AAC.1
MGEPGGSTTALRSRGPLASEPPRAEQGKKAPFEGLQHLPRCPAHGRGEPWPRVPPGGLLDHEER